VTVSVVIPTYDHGHVVMRAVQSVLQQTFKDFEIIVVDDGSKDNTRRLFELNRDPSVSYVVQKHKGRSAARNRGIQLARGRYIAFLDADDWYFPRKLERQVAALEAHPNATLSHTSYLRVDESGTPLEIIRSGRLTGCVLPSIWWACPIAAPTVMVRREALEDRLLFDEQVHIGEDIHFWAQVAGHGDILGIDECLTAVTLTRCSSALLPEHQILAARNLLKAIENIQSAPRPAVARRIQAELWINMAVANFALKRYREVAACALRSHRAWPFSHRLYCLAIRKCIGTARRGTKKVVASAVHKLRRRMDRARRDRYHRAT